MAVSSAPVVPTRRTRAKKVDPLLGAFTDTQSVEEVPPLKVPACWKMAEEIITAGHYRVLLYGIPGTGKTYIGLHAPIREKMPPVYNIYLGEETAAYQIVGVDAIENGKMVWRDGPALLQRRTGGRLVINEIDHASGDALDALIWICDDPDTAAQGVVLSTGETVYPHEWMQFIATMNGEPEDLGDALSDRFKTQIRITCPHPLAIRALPRQMWEIAEQLTDEATPASQRISIRQFRSFAQLVMEGVSSKTAAVAAFHHRADELLKTINLVAA